MVKFNDLKVGEILSETQFYVVTQKAGDRAQFSTDGGEPVVLTKEYIEKLLSSADQFAETNKVTKTMLADIMKANPNKAMTVCFNKQVKKEDVVAALEDTYPNTGGKLMSKADFLKAVKKVAGDVITGQERIMKGRHYGSVDDMGRISFVDMEQERGDGDYDKRLRLVDPRTINWLIVNDIKYIKK